MKKVICMASIGGVPSSAFKETIIDIKAAEEEEKKKKAELAAKKAKEEKEKAEKNKPTTTLAQDNALGKIQAKL